MKRFRDLSYRSKLMISNTAIVVLIAAAITVALTLTASERAVDNNKASLNLLTEQMLINFDSATGNMRQHLYSMLASNAIDEHMNKLRGRPSTDTAYHQGASTLSYGLSNVIDAQAPYDNLLVRMTNGAYAANMNSDASAIFQAHTILAAEPYQNEIGAVQWIRAEDGQLFFISDVYSTMPLRRVGVIAARIRQEMLTSLGSYNQTLNCTILFYDRNHHFITSAGIPREGIEREAQPFLDSLEATLRHEEEEYIAAVHSNASWMAVGLMPTSISNEVHDSIIRSGFLVAILGILVGVGLAMTVSHQMSRQVHTLLTSMDKVAAGKLNLVIPVESRDEIGQLTEHFNRTTRQTHELLDRIVQEESNKRMAEYQILEYKYRFLQWQINPHFIYNALETINAMAKLDGNNELCDMILHISSYFRMNANTMRRRFVPVLQEFSDLQLYAYIYQKIYGELLKTTFEVAQEVSDALIPTMMIQPLLENALVHGVRGGEKETAICVSARSEEDGRLTIGIQDNGFGMDEQTIRQILDGEVRKTDAVERSDGSIGMRNVLDRMRLMYGDRATMRIDSQKNVGTSVTLSLPLCFEETQFQP